jgi:uncharacterized membrane protein YraQ (UPF0718 family)
MKRSARNLKESYKKNLQYSGKLILGKATTSQFIALIICMFIEWKFSVEIDYIASNFIAIVIGVMYNYLKMSNEEKENLNEKALKETNKLLERAKIWIGLKDKGLDIEEFDKIDLNFTKKLKSGEKNGEKESEKAET